MNFPRYERYKDSGVEWLGEIPEHWETKKLKHLAIIRNGSTPKISIPNCWDGNIVWITPSDLGRLKTKLIYDSERKITKSGLESCGTEISPKNSIIISSRAPIGHLCVTAVRSCINQGCKSIISRQNKANSSYFYYFLMAARKNIESLGKGSTFQELGGNELANYIVIAPPIAEQERIAEFLDRKCGEIDEAIAKKQRLIELLDEQKTILINQAVTKGLNPDAPMKDSAIDWLGQIPAHWETKKLKYLFREVDNRSENGSETLLSLRMYEGLVPHNDVSEKRIQAENLIGYKKIKKGQIVMNRMRAAIGLFGLASCSGLVSPDYAVFDPWKKLEEQYFLWLFKTDALKDAFRLESKGLGTGSSGFLRLYFDRFGMIKVPFPGVQEQKQIVAYIDTTSTAISKAVSRINKHIEIMKELKQILIAEAVTGKIKV